MQTGKIVRLMDKGYGFVQADGGDKDLFFHANSLVDIAFDQLEVDMKVTFEEEDGQKGPQAVNVQLASDDATPADDSSDDASADAE